MIVNEIEDCFTIHINQLKRILCNIINEELSRGEIKNEKKV